MYGGVEVSRPAEFIINTRLQVPGPTMRSAFSGFPHQSLALLGPAGAETLALATGKSSTSTGAAPNEFESTLRGKR